MALTLHKATASIIDALSAPKQ